MEQPPSIRCPGTDAGAGLRTTREGSGFGAIAAAGTIVDQGVLAPPEDWESVNPMANIPAPAAVPDRRAVYRRTLAVVVLSQILGGAGLAAGVTVGALLAQDMLGSSSLSGLPAALFTLGSAGAAYLVGQVSQRSGRRAGLSCGYAAGAFGGAAVAAAAVLGNVWLLLPALLVYGAGTATNLQARYTGADLATPHQRGRAVSTVLFATTLGAVAGPNLVGRMGDLALRLGMPELSGPFALAAVAYALAGIVLFALLRPDPLLVAREIDAAGATAAMPVRPAARGSLASIFGGGVGLGAAVMVVTQMVMLAIMSMTPIHMRAHGHGLAETGLVIGAHVGAMYLPSPLTGLLVDRVGRVPVVAASGVTLLAAATAAALAPGHSIGALALSLALLGLGWNFGLLSGTAIVADATPPESRARTQGVVDLCVALAGATGGMLSGVVVAASSFAALSLLGGAVALAIIPVAVAVSRATPRVSPGQRLVWNRMPGWGERGGCSWFMRRRRRRRPMRPSSGSSVSSGRSASRLRSSGTRSTAPWKKESCCAARCPARSPRTCCCGTASVGSSCSRCRRTASST
jgi:MFS family permease